MRLNGTHWNEAALIELGRQQHGYLVLRTVEEDGNPLGYDVSPDLDMAGYDAAAEGQGDPAPAPVTTFKADVIRRCTDDEADAFDAALAEASSKLRLLWNSVTVMDHAAAEFATLRGAIIGALKTLSMSDAVAATRADELLAPSA